MTDAAFRFLAHEGELARLIAAFDWSSTSLGAPEQWPQSLKTTISTLLQSPVPIVTLWGEDGIMIYNDAYSEFAAARHPQLLGSKVREGWPEVAAFNDNIMKVVLAGGKLAYADQKLILNRSGRPEKVWMNLFYSPVINEDGKPSGVIAIVVETTAKVRAEQRIVGERERLKKMFQQAPGFMAMLSGDDHRFEMVNDAYLELIGRREVIGRALTEALPELAGQGFKELLDHVRESGEPHIGETAPVALERSVGQIEERFVDFVFQPVLEDDGTPVGVFVQGNDVTAQREANLALLNETRLLGILNKLGAELASELDLEKVVNRITDASVELTGAEFGAFFYNVQDDKGERYMLYSLSGVSAEKFAQFPMPRATSIFQPTFKGEGVIRSDDIMADPRYGQSAPYNGMPPGHLPVRSYLAVAVVSRSGEVIGGLFYGHSKTGQFKQEHEDLIVGAAGLAAIAMDNARLFQALDRELAERTRAEGELQILNSNLEERVAEEVQERTKAEDALRQAQKMEAIGQLTGGIAHDFNNLLQVISGNLQLLSKDIGGNSVAEKRVRNALAGVDRGSKLASQLLAFGRRQALDPKVVNIGRFVSGMEEMLRRTLGEGVEIETIRSAGLWNALVDPTQIENAVLNLAINARDAMNGTGKLTLEVLNSVLDDGYARLHEDVPAGHYVQLAVTDTGHGMTPEVMAQVFEPFFSTKAVDKGTGLGLSMVYGFVKQSGGHVKVYSEVGEGTTIRLYFPRVRQEEDTVAEQDFGPITGGTETILVAEDDEQVRATVVELLGDLGYRVLKAKDAAAALNIVESGISIDLLFTDVVMPGTLKSAELARQARERIPGLAVLFTSGYTENSIVHGGRLDAGVELLSKPYTREALARKVRHVLNNGRQRANSVPGRSDEQPPLKSETVSKAILLVEDDALIRMSSVDMIEELGYHVAEAESAEAALKVLEAGRPIDVMVTDLGLPGMSGEGLARQVRLRWPHIAIVFATGRHDAPVLDDSARTALLIKPFSSIQLDRILKDLDER